MSNHKIENPILGGAYKDVRNANDGGEVHHIPSWKSYSNNVIPLTREEGPAIWMETVDHYQTASWGRSRVAQNYHNRQQNLIAQGLFAQAQQMDIDDIRSNFGNKYDQGIEQALNYTNQIIDRTFPN